MPHAEDNIVSMNNTSFYQYALSTTSKASEYICPH
ncbi:Uncharacterised protein [Bacteroides heparinolyticus]|uniref:Uncharacterized protein n=1 Tax=Prevotella heparinolytica TaxID=28113 RepID=A0A449I7S6_9BACE|nr:Uncharacterised protein [Bacteroides heparinolyticus]